MHRGSESTRSLPNANEGEHSEETEKHAADEQHGPLGDGARKQLASDDGQTSAERVADDRTECHTKGFTSGGLRAPPNEQMRVLRVVSGHR